MCTSGCIATWSRPTLALKDEDPGSRCGLKADVFKKNLQTLWPSRGFGRWRVVSNTTLRLSGGVYGILAQRWAPVGPTAAQRPSLHCWPWKALVSLWKKPGSMTWLMWCIHCVTIECYHFQFWPPALFLQYHCSLVGGILFWWMPLQRMTFCVTSGFCTHGASFQTNKFENLSCAQTMGQLCVQVLDLECLLAEISRYKHDPSCKNCWRSRHHPKNQDVSVHSGTFRTSKSRVLAGCSLTRCWMRRPQHFCSHPWQLQQSYHRALRYRQRVHRLRRTEVLNKCCQKNENGPDHAFSCRRLSSSVEIEVQVPVQVSQGEVQNLPTYLRTLLTHLESPEEGIACDVPSWAVEWLDLDFWTMEGLLAFVKDVAISADRDLVDDTCGELAPERAEKNGSDTDRWSSAKECSEGGNTSGSMWTMSA